MLTIHLALFSSEFPVILLHNACIIIYSKLFSRLLSKQSRSQNDTLLQNMTISNDNTTHWFNNVLIVLLKVYQSTFNHFLRNLDAC